LLDDPLLDEPDDPPDDFFNDSPAAFAAASAWALVVWVFPWDFSTAFALARASAWSAFDALGILGYGLLSLGFVGAGAFGLVGAGALGLEGAGAFDLVAMLFYKVINKFGFTICLSTPMSMTMLSSFVPSSIFIMAYLSSYWDLYNSKMPLSFTLEE